MATDKNGNEYASGGPNGDMEHRHQDDEANVHLGTMTKTNSTDVTVTDGSNTKGVLQMQAGKSDATPRGLACGAELITMRRPAPSVRPV